MMGFSTEEKQQLLVIKGIGPTVVMRLEQLGFNSITQLASADVQDITRRMAELVGSNCWQNSPIAKASINAVILLARQQAAEQAKPPHAYSENHCSY